MQPRSYTPFQYSNNPCTYYSNCLQMGFIYKSYNKAFIYKTRISVQYTALLNLHLYAMHSNTLSIFIKYKTLHHMNYFIIMQYCHTTC